MKPWGRQFLPGSRHPNARLTETQVRVIRASDESTSVLARRYGVTTVHIRNLRNGSAFAHIGGAKPAGLTGEERAADLALAACGCASHRRCTTCGEYDDPTQMHRTSSRQYQHRGCRRRGVRLPKRSGRALRAWLRGQVPL